MQKIMFAMMLGLTCFMSSCAEKEQEGVDLDQMVFAEDEEKASWHADSDATQEIVITEPESTLNEAPR